MAYRNGGGSRVSEFEERDAFYRDPPRRGPPPGREEIDIYERREQSRGPPPFRRGPPPPREEIDIYERREESRGPPPSRAPVKEYEDIDIHIREREREQDRTPAFLREDARRTDAGPLVLRSREIETVDRRRPRSPSPVRVREQRIVRARSLTPPPPPERIQTRIVERERERSPAPPPMERVRTRFIERERERSPSPPDFERTRTRIIERQRERSPSPPPERERIRIIDRERERVPSPSPSPPPPPPPPPVIRGPTIEREVITHYRDIDHGIERVKVPSPPPPPRPRERESETDIDIYTSRNRTEVDIHKSRTRSRSRSRPAPARRSEPNFYEDDLVVRTSDRERDSLRVSDTTVSRRRAASAAPSPRDDYAEEAEYITSKIDSRGRMGEAWHGHTKDWTIVDVPPGTERVRMDGVGGGGAEVTWQRYNGVRRAKFLPEREESVVEEKSSSTALSEPVRDRDRLSVQIYDSTKVREPSRDRVRESDIDVDDTRVVIRDRERDMGVGKPRASRPRTSEMWTEITKDLVVREAVEELGYEYEETEFFFYVMNYLRYEDVLELVNRSDQIRRARRERAREIEWEREYRDDWERRDRRHRHRRSIGWDKYDDERERIVEREVLYDRAPRWR